METERQENLHVRPLLQDAFVDVHGVLELVDADRVRSDFVTSRVERVQHLVSSVLNMAAYLRGVGPSDFWNAGLSSRGYLQVCCASSREGRFLLIRINTDSMTNGLKVKQLASNSSIILQVTRIYCCNKYSKTAKLCSGMADWCKYAL